jgi:hypothetical protein
MRFQLSRAIYADFPFGPGRLAAGTFVITTPGDRQLPTDVLWTNPPTNLPTNVPGAPTGADSVSG